MIGELRTMVADTEHLLGQSPESLREQIGGLEYARRLRQAATKLETQLEAAVCDRRESHDLVEAGGWVAEILAAPKRKQWDQPALRQDARTKILEVAVTPEDVLDMLWHDELGLHPLNGSMRVRPLRDIWGLDPDEYCTTTRPLKATVVRKPEQ